MSALSLRKILLSVCVVCFTTSLVLPAQTFTTLANFDGTDGNMPSSMTLIQGVDGNFYGTTFSGGAYGAGTVFEVSAQGVLTVLYSFCAQKGCPDGKNPVAGLVQASDGNFYGTTSLGGANNDGTVFEITAEGKLTTLHTFNGADGSGPSSLIQASNGNFYGATSNGGGSNACNGPGCGTIFEITPAGEFTTLHTFSFSDGWIPSGLVQASNGNFYGTTARGGMVSDVCPTGPGCGTVFEITPTANLTTLYTFQGNDGWSPYGGLVQGTDGNFYGTTFFGGASNACNTAGCGTVFVITPAGELTTLHSFDITDGAGPYAALVQATDGNFYGATVGGGLYGVNLQNFGCGDGTLFEITPEGELTTLLNFDQTDGAQPWGGLVQATDGSLYGTTSVGGTSPNCGGGCGTVFSLSLGLNPFVKTEPMSGVVGASVIILGTDLAGATGVTFNGAAARFTVVSNSEIRTTVPAGASTGKVEVATPHGVISSNAPFRVGPERLWHGRFPVRPAL